MKKTVIKIILLIIAIPILASTKPTMPGEKSSLIFGTVNIGRSAEIMKKMVNATSQEEMSEYTKEFHEYAREPTQPIISNINLNEKILVCFAIHYSHCFTFDNDNNPPFSANDSIEIELSLEGGGILGNDNLIFNVNEPDSKHMTYGKFLFTYLFFEKQGIYKLHYTTQIKTDKPKLEKYNYSFTRDKFFAFTEYGNIIEHSKEALNKKLEELKRRKKEHEEAEERYKENKNEKDKEKKLMRRSDVPHIIKHIIEFEEEDDVVKDTLKKYNIEYEFEDDKFIFRKPQRLRLKETNLKYEVVESIYEEITEEEQRKYNEELELKIKKKEKE